MANDSRQSRLVSGSWLFALVNVLVSLLITTPLAHRAITDSTGSVPAVGLMFLSTLVGLNLAYGLGLMLLAVVRTPRWLLAALAVPLAWVLQLFLIADVRVFAIFKFHINGFILNFLTTEGSEDSLKLGAATLTTFVLAGLVVLAVELFLARTLFFRPSAWLRLRQKAALLFAVLALLVVLDKAVYAWADLTGRVTILSAARYCPLYPKVTVKRLAIRWFGYRPDRDREMALRGSGRTLNYPRHPLTFDPHGPRYNVLFVLADGFRSDMLSPSVTPHLYEFAQQSLEFDNHFSGGNGTRFGVFSMLYGLYPNLWQSFLAARQGPVLVDALRELHYEFVVLCSTRLTFPEFRQTAFVNIPEAISDEHPEPKMYQRDAALVAEFHQFLERRPAGRPFFGFVFFNSSHPFYQYPPEFEKFRPVVEEKINYMSELTPAKVRGLKNRYQNALYYTDSLLEQLTADLRRHGLLDNTILVITGDHGEEFEENGYYSHNSAFDDYQIKTTMVMRIPGESPRKVTAMTSHLDLVPTVLGRLGCTNPPSDYCHGRDILATAPRSFVFCSDWDSGALVTERERVILPIGSASAHLVELRTARDYQLVGDKEALKKYRPMMTQVARELGEFLK